MKRVLGQLYDFAENGDEYLFYNKKEFEESLRYDEGLKEGHEKGLAEGREEGIKEGYENGREEKGI